MKTAGTRNPVILLDEIDKLGVGLPRRSGVGAARSAGPEQNWNFNDHYLDVPYDLSEVLFITTANNLYAHPAPVARPHGSDRDQRVYRRRKSANRPAVSAAAPVAGPRPGSPARSEIPEKMLRVIIRTYTREAGVRELERKLAAICRKAARQRGAGAHHAGARQLAQPGRAPRPGPARQRRRHRRAWVRSEWRWGWRGPSTGANCCRWKSRPCRGGAA